MLQGRVHRRHLIDGPSQTRQRWFDGGLRNVHGLALEDFAFRVRGGGGDAEAGARQVLLVGIERELGEFGGFAEQDRQQA